MTYQVIVEMANSPSLAARIAAAAAAEQLPSIQPTQWAQTYAWRLAATPGWAEAWESAKTTQTAQFNPDTGARPDVITDQMILAAVQPLITGGGTEGAP